MSVPTYDALKLPSHVKTILITGAGGFVGQKLTELLLERFPSLRIITTDIIEPPTFTSDKSRLRVVKADLGDASQLNGIMSGGSEANFELGYAVNVDSHVALLEAAHAHAKATGQEGATKPVYVFVSSLAIYGGPKCRPQDFVVPDETPLLPGTSYGVEKNIIELYAYDYGRKAPSTAASSFMSGVIREPLQGIPTVVPIASGLDDDMLDTMGCYVTRFKTVIRNIAYAICMPESKFKKGESRSINLPGIKVTPRQMLQALEEHGGPEALKLVSFKVDSAVLAICETWAGDYDSTLFQSMGFEVDDKATGYGLAVQDFKQELAAAKK
ncbi:hypothetical protein EHS25_007058 [Saitozyma podzolica]|uniref:NAD-dependent epimerase/dehydratase domain-containing protein n=1 Tax=Saitozyma podzolica TaxID=1890683 RepID=A0A427XPG2_9TREE|nr:hypothetical protein EHS25_007058 [Saitozyma podzolica]